MSLPQVPDAEEEEDLDRLGVAVRALGIEGLGLVGLRIPYGWGFRVFGIQGLRFRAQGYGKGHFGASGAYGLGLWYCKRPQHPSTKGPLHKHRLCTSSRLWVP